MTNQNLLICTDLDRTVIPNGEQPESSNARQLFKELVTNDFINLAYVSGRDKVLIEKAIYDYHLPIPNYIIADVGATIYVANNSHNHDYWLRLKEWDQKLTLSWHHQTAQDLEPLFCDLKDCRLQEPEKQSLHKLSYYVDLDIDQEFLFDQVKLRLENINIEANLIWSIDEQENIGLLDILPINANKKLAIDFLMSHYNFTLENTVFSGDSGNDLDVLISPIKSILVANGHPELKRNMIEKMEQNGLSHTLYIAKGGYLNMNGNYCAGILEGINYYFPELIIKSL